jgi:hypothetical protein
MSRLCSHGKAAVRRIHQGGASSPRCCRPIPTSLRAPLASVPPTHIAAGSQLCAWLEGRTTPLSALVERLAERLPAGADPTAVRTSVVDLAQRKCYSAKDGEGERGS